MILSFSLRMDSVSNENTKPKTVEFSFEQSNSETEPPKPPRLFSVRSDVPDRSLIPNRAREIPNLAPNESNRVRLPEEHPRPRKIGFLFALLVLILLASSFVIPWGPPSVYPRLWILATLSLRPCSLLRAAFKAPCRVKSK